MKAPWTPFRWPGSWKDPSALEFVKGTGIDTLVLGKGGELGAVRASAHEQGIAVVEADAPPHDVTVIKGEWPGVQMGRGGGAQASAGPTGAPWVDSNGWAIQLAAAMHPDCAVWVDAALPPDARAGAPGFVMAVADACAYGGRWLITLPPALADGIAGENGAALDTWKAIARAAGFFAERKAWAQEFAPAGVAAVISDFAGENEFFSHELLNLLARAGVHYVVVKKDAPGGSLAGRRAVIYADAQAPSAELRERVMAFVRGGGTLITVPKWGDFGGAVASGEAHPRYTVRAVGKGTVAMANAQPDDPYVMANDAAVLISHRYDLVRFWNGGATGSVYTASPERGKVVAHLLFYANRGPDAASVRVAGRFSGVTAHTINGPVAKLEVVRQRDAVEVHLPPVNQYVALELEGTAP